ncbi:Glutathione gamma-glutamylcysteinyltransferase 1 [Raphanus sativus]|nr:Glutathione gamma-glutamylcysteinyltransferase 1 [Raphanus sativus]
MAMKSVYRRSLPSPPAIDFSSSEGKKIFNEALQKGTMEGFFKLISYFQTQSEPAYCGLASLPAVLNALSIRSWTKMESAEEKSRLDLKHVVLKEVHETVLSGCSSKEFCCQETCVKCVNDPGEAEGMVVTGVVVCDRSEQKVDLLVPSTQNDCECGPEANYPAGNDVFTVLLLALAPHTWSGIKDQALRHEMKQLILMASLSTMLQEELKLSSEMELIPVISRTTFYCVCVDGTNRSTFNNTLGSLSVVLNALSIDSDRKWKGSWRWVDELMLDWCEPLEIVKEKGISFGKLVYLAHCSGAKVESFRTSQSTIDDFRKFLVKCSVSEKCHMIEECLSRWL